MRQTWIIYKSDDPDATGWEDRQLLPSGSLTSVLSEEWHYSRTPEIPKAGDRVREYANAKDPGNEVTHGRDGDWAIVRVCQFASFDTRPLAKVHFFFCVPLRKPLRPLR